VDVERAIKEIQDALIVMAEIERRQSALLREHAEYLGELVKFRNSAEPKIDEIDDKLNGLIGYLAGLRPPPA
jgi:hypothetical protein